MLFTGCVSVMPVSPAAYAAAEDDVLQALKWTERNGEITITGCTKDLPQELVIPAEIEGKPVTALGAYAFAETPITSVVIPEGVKVIENNVFAFCTKLADVSLPASIEKIGQNVFAFTKWLKQHPYNVDDLYIAEQNILIKADILRFEFGSKAVIPDGIRYIAGGAFESCEFTSVTIPDSVKGLGDNAFDNCTQLLTVTVPEGVTEIGASAFNGCRQLRSVSLPKTLCSIGESAFIGCDLLSAVTFADSTDGLTEIPKNAFRSCIELTSVNVPESVTSFGDFAFFGCWKLKDFVLPPTLAHIGENALSNCYALESLTLPETLRYIPDNAFTLCENIPEITVPSRVTEIGAQAFWICKKLEKLTVLNPACVFYDAADTASIDHEDTFPGVIAGYEGSEAQVYAKKYNREFESLGEAPAPLPGDLNGDGEVSVDDAQNALRAYTNLVAHKPSGLAAYRTKAADTDGDGQLTVSDAQYILQYYTMQLAGNAVTWEQLIRKTE